MGWGSGFSAGGFSEGSFSVGEAPIDGEVSTLSGGVFSGWEVLNLAIVLGGFALEVSVGVIEGLVVLLLTIGVGSLG